MTNKKEAPVEVLVNGEICKVHDRKDGMTLLINTKIELLYDFCFLRHKGAKGPDPREAAVRAHLESLDSEVLIDNAIHGVLTYDYTVDVWCKN